MVVCVTTNISAKDQYIGQYKGFDSDGYCLKLCFKSMMRRHAI